LRALLAEARQHDPQRGALATRAILSSDLHEIRAAGRFDLLGLIRIWGDQLPATCPSCGTRLNATHDVGGFSVTTAGHALKPRYALVSGFCHDCAARGHEAMRVSAMRDLQRDGIAAEILGMGADPA